ncbi:MAG: DUF1648 domain-containing protein [Anaerorhabdus sp.]|uniref:DUF1648 domain-containing protein n=1 Tax=Anaerorhabdus sp. TaxID=1872524 RepID=UPI002B20ACB4|nr:DUF1648 domain-containing protein [Anaerorhabdus sp.]MEA4873988.1 DUF1648 domain-containing protein [Anaerorhabdus sp.]
MNSAVLYVFGLMSLVWGIIIFLISFIPYYSNGMMVFGIAIPKTQMKNYELHKIKDTYAWFCIIAGILLALASMLTYFRFQSLKTMWIQIFAIFIYLWITIFFYIKSYKKVKKLKETNDWVIDTTKEGTEINSISLSSTFNHWIYLILLIVIGVGIGLVAYRYPMIPDKIPMHFNMEGVATHYVTKSLETFAILPIIQVLIMVVFVGISIAIDKARSNANNQRDHIYKKSMGYMLFFIGLLITIFLSSLEISLAGIIPGTLIKFLPVFYVVILFIMLVYFSAKVGQGGNRINDNAEINTLDDEQYWHFGIFYNNKKDPSLFVENRVGLGLTMNFGNKLSWIVIGGMGVFVISILILTRLL